VPAFLVFSLRELQDVRQVGVWVCCPCISHEAEHHLLETRKTKKREFSFSFLFFSFLFFFWFVFKISLAELTE